MTLLLSTTLRRSSASSAAVAVAASTTRTLLRTSTRTTSPRCRGIGSVSSFRISQSRLETTEEEYQQAQRTLIRTRDPAAVETAWHQLQHWRNNLHQSQASSLSSKRLSQQQQGSLSSSTNTTNTYNHAASSSLIGNTSLSAP